MKRILLLLLLLFIGFMFYCIYSNNNRDAFVKNCHDLLKNNETYLYNVISVFQKKNSNIKAIYVNGEKDIRILFSRDHIDSLKFSKSHLYIQDLYSTNSELKKLDKGSEIRSLISFMIENGLDTFIFSNSKVLIGFKTGPKPKPYLIHGHYNWRKGLRTYDEMVDLYSDSKSEYWIYKLDPMWHVESNPN